MAVAKFGLRKIGDKVYYPRYWYKSKSEANIEAGKSRKRGWKCRVMGVAGGYAVYRPLS